MIEWIKKNRLLVIGILAAYLVVVGLFVSLAIGRVNDRQVKKPSRIFFTPTVSATSLPSSTATPTSVTTARNLWVARNVGPDQVKIGDYMYDLALFYNVDDPSLVLYTHCMAPLDDSPIPMVTLYYLINNKVSTNQNPDLMFLMKNAEILTPVDGPESTLQRFWIMR